MDLAQMITTGTNAIEAIKKAIGLARKAQVAELEELLLDLRDDIASLRDANIELRTENGELREQLKLRQEMVFDRNVYWQVANDDKRIGPFCPRCFGDRGKANPLGYHEVRLPGYSTQRSYRCAVCGLAMDVEP